MKFRKMRTWLGTDSNRNSGFQRSPNTFPLRPSMASVTPSKPFAAIPTCSLPNQYSGLCMEFTINCPNPKQAISQLSFWKTTGWNGWVFSKGCQCSNTAWGLCLSLPTPQYEAKNSHAFPHANIGIPLSIACSNPKRKSLSPPCTSLPPPP